MLKNAHRDHGRVQSELLDACYYRGITFFGCSAFKMMGLLNPKSSGVRYFLEAFLCVQHVGHAIVHRAEKNFFPIISFFARDVELLKW